MNIPESATLNEINSVGGMAYVGFTWNRIQFAYVGGDLDLDAFRTSDADTLTVGECEVIVPDDSNTVAAWKTDDIVYYISCEESLPDEDLLTLLNELLSPKQAIR